jgi:hypothetical protein
VDKHGNDVPFDAIPSVLEMECKFDTNEVIELSTPTLQMGDGYIKITDLIPRGRSLPSECVDAVIEFNIGILNIAQVTSHQ